jgi:hypothetical protein
MHGVQVYGHHNPEKEQNGKQPQSIERIYKWKRYVNVVRLDLVSQRLFLNRILTTLHLPVHGFEVQLVVFYDDPRKHSVYEHNEGQYEISQ